jgi:hypothetical protein
MELVAEKGAQHAAPLQMQEVLDVVQRAGLQTGNLQNNQIKKTGETAHWQFGRPFLGQNTGHNMQPAVPSALLEVCAQRKASPSLLRSLGVLGNLWGISFRLPDSPGLTN